ncbi:hypothetical protein K503DRAFT_519279 [Rhizopogon vinicolor AM-OR11-026]|uniref:Uncharacterized protein n=1 Tax=Rhizopogon vinicolor AM-OR11-026 TaxID=1314800 RepID=A0A1B7MLJ2_9AGAM|nr:hypothetical protein K503DRAFT_519279 [Rhizopogon vinicolor AM-OR11-026]
METFLLFLTGKSDSESALLCCCALPLVLSFHTWPRRDYRPHNLLGNLTRNVLIYPQDGPVHESIILLHPFPCELPLPSRCRIATSLVSGSLASTCAYLTKVAMSPANETPNYQQVICLYIPDIYDKNAVMDLLNILFVGGNGIDLLRSNVLVGCCEAYASTPGPN